MQMQEEKVAITRDDLILIQLRDLKENFRELRSEVKETSSDLNSRMNRIIEQRIEKLKSKIELSSNHGQISNITTIGIALAVIYAVLK